MICFGIINRYFKNQMLCFIRRAVILLLILAIIGWLLPRDIFAEELKVGSVLPAVAVADKGEANFKDKEQKKLKFNAWESSHTLGDRLAYVQHLAGRLGIEDMNKLLSDAIVAMDIPPEQLVSLIIINADDSIFGTGWLISSKIKDNKRTYPDSTFIHDADGVVATEWSIPPETATSMIVAADGTILFHKQGQTTSKDVAKALKIINKNLNSKNKTVLDTSTVADD